MTKRILSGVFLALFLALTGWIFYQGTRPPVLSVGSPHPGLSIGTSDGARRLADITGPFTLIYFHSGCAYCRHEFDALEDGFDDTWRRHLVLVTGEDSLPDTTIRQRWPTLARSGHVIWATADRREFKSRFGTLVTPAIFVFDGSGTLRKKFVGETKIEALRLASDRDPDGGYRR